MEPIEFSKVFLNDDEPYQEYVQIIPIDYIKDEQSIGDHVILSEYSRELQFRKRLQHPLKFKLTTDKYVTYCSVREYSAPAGACKMPLWMMKKLNIQLGEYIHIESIAIPKGKKVQVRFLDKAMLEITDVKSALEQQFKNYIVLSEGDRIPFYYYNIEYHIEIVKCEPESVIDINNTNLTVDFAPMDENEQVIQPKASNNVERVPDRSHVLQGDATDALMSGREKRLAFFNRNTNNCCVC